MKNILRESTFAFVLIIFFVCKYLQNKDLVINKMFKEISWKLKRETLYYKRHFLSENR